MPLLVFMLLALICLGLLGFACACFDDQAALALERALQAPAVPEPIDLWPQIVLGLGGTALLVLTAVLARERASPARLQRFLF